MYTIIFLAALVFIPQLGFILKSYFENKPDNYPERVRTMIISTITSSLIALFVSLIMNRTFSEEAINTINTADQFDKLYVTHDKYILIKDLEIITIDTEQTSLKEADASSNEYKLEIDNMKPICGGWCNFPSIPEYQYRLYVSEDILKQVENTRLKLTELTSASNGLNDAE